MAKRVDLTPKQLEVYDYIVAFRKRQRYSPTLSEIGDELGMSKPTVFEHCNKIVDKGWLRKDADRTRNLVPVEQGANQ